MLPRWKARKSQCISDRSRISQNLRGNFLSRLFVHLVCPPTIRQAEALIERLPRPDGLTKPARVRP
jgi:hypothetical protein